MKCSNGIPWIEKHTKITYKYLLYSHTCAFLQFARDVSKMYFKISNRKLDSKDKNRHVAVGSDLVVVSVFIKGREYRHVGNERFWASDHSEMEGWDDFRDKAKFIWCFHEGFCRCEIAPPNKWIDDEIETAGKKRFIYRASERERKGERAKGKTKGVERSWRFVEEEEPILRKIY